MAEVSSTLYRLRRELQYYASGFYQELTTKRVFLFAQAMAFKVLVSIVPIIVLATGILAQFLQMNESFRTVSDLVRTFLPAYQSESLIQFLSELQQASGTLTAVGVVGLLLSAMTLITTVRMAVSGAFRQEWHTERSLLGGYAFDLRMVIQVGLLFSLTIALSFFLQLLSTETSAVANQLSIEFLAREWERTLQIITLVLPFLVSMAMFYQLLYFIPLPHPPKRSAFVGAFCTTVLWEAAKISFTVYAANAGEFDRYTQNGGMLTGVGSVFGLLLAFVVWIYYSGLVLMFGAIIASLHERHQRQSEDIRIATAHPPIPQPAD